MDEQVEFIKLIASRLDNAGIPYMMTGSMALAIYSMPRMTRDIDLIIEVDPSKGETVIKLFSGDCYIDEESVRTAIRNRGMFNIIHNTWMMKADFIIRKDDAYRKKEFGRRQKVDIEGVALSVVAPEDLILSKLVWSKDSLSDLQLRDVKQIIESVSTLDWDYVQKWAKIIGVDELLKKAKDNE